VQAQGEDERGQEEGGGAEVNPQRSRDLWRTAVLLVSRGRRAFGTQARDTLFGSLLHDEGGRGQNRFLKCDDSCFLFEKANSDVPSTHNIIYVCICFDVHLFVLCDADVGTVLPITVLFCPVLRKNVLTSVDCNLET
jgi:hypothetical protein